MSWHWTITVHFRSIIIVYLGLSSILGVEGARPRTIPLYNVEIRGRDVYDY